MLRRLGRNLGSGAAARLLGAAFGFLLVVLMARLWDAEAFATFAVAFAWFQIAQLVPLLGAHFVLARRAAEAGAKAAPDFAATAAIGTLAALPLGGGLMLLGEVLYDGSLRSALFMVALALLATAPATVAEMWLLGRERLGRVAAVTIAEAALRCIVCGGLVVLGAGVAGVLAGVAALRGIALLCFLADDETRAALRPGAVTAEAVRQRLRAAPPLLAILVLATLFARIDLPLLPLFADPATVADYAIAVRLYDLALMVPAILLMALMPMMTRMCRHGADRLGAFAGLLLRYGLGLAVPLAVVAGWLAVPLLPLAFGPGFAEAVPALHWLLAATLCMAVNQLLSAVLLALDRQALDLPAVAGGLAALLAGLAMLVLGLGAAGAGAAAFLGAAVQVVIRAAAVRRAAGPILSPAEALPAGLGAAALGIVLLAGDGSALALLLGLAAYAAVFLATAGVRRTDGRAMRALLAPAGATEP